MQLYISHCAVSQGNAITLPCDARYYGENKNLSAKLFHKESLFPLRASRYCS